MNAFTFGLSASMRARYARTISVDETWRAFRSDASSWPDLKTRSLVAMSRPPWVEDGRGLDEIVDVQVADDLKLIQVAAQRRIDHGQPLVRERLAANRGRLSQGLD